MVRKRQGWHGDSRRHSEAARKGWKDRRRQRPIKSAKADLPSLGKLVVKVLKDRSGSPVLRIYLYNKLTEKRHKVDIRAENLSSFAVNRALGMGINSMGIPIPDTGIVEEKIGQIASWIADEF